jgi:hypothetical protein
MSGGNVTIVAGGWSVRDISLRNLCGQIIAVNDAAHHPPTVDIVVSMDRLWTEHRWSWLCRRAAATWLRRSAVQNLDVQSEVAAGWLHVFECDHDSTEFSSEPGRLNGTNSGMCAMNLAWQMQPSNVYLLGFDMCRDHKGRASWHPPYPWAQPTGATSNAKYAAWAAQFDDAALRFASIGCDVWNVSPASAITAFPKMTPADYRRECDR